MGTVADKLRYLSDTKIEIRDAIEEKGVAIPDDEPFSVYPDYLTSIETGARLESVTAYPESEDVEVTPSEGYDGLMRVLIKKESNLRPENIRAGVTIFGVTGTMVVKEGT